MALLYLIIALIIQGSFTHDIVENSTEQTDSHEAINGKLDDVVIDDFHNDKKDWFDFFLLPDADLYPTSSIAMMTQATNSEKSMEEQLEDIKEIAEKITLALQSEMANLLAYAISTTNKTIEETDVENNNLRKRRSVETPMGSTKLITRLLKHIKSNNEYQNIAIDKMMTAQEIADKYGVEFSPDVEIISDLAISANQQADEMASLLQDALNMKNTTKRIESSENKQDEDVYYIYPYAEHEQIPRTPTAHPVVNHQHHAESYPSFNYYYNYPYESQIPAPVSNYYSPPVTKRPNFYDAVSYSPDYYPPYCSMDPVPEASTIILPFEEQNEPEAELVGEEFEETISSKLYVDRGDEPGSATVNHVMTYTIAEKSHFRKPEIERLPEQMQYYFLLM
ncbi:unnamed protein product [Arctia plantaginis]|uniref:Uncharacterized protein n=1 Tax=Arctia plantaginis TaxID=874455 RepID=A0A8S0YL34_ARCPL|nr:unnamed protein product [Arctia plantaginis]